MNERTGEDGRTAVDLLGRARDATERAYAPYSEYEVGAALETSDGAVYTGCNIENANFSNSLHAEEVAIGAAIRDGHRDFSRLAVSSAARDSVTPCGMCRQTLAEFCDEDFLVLVETQAGTGGEGSEPTDYRLGDLIPDTITPEMVLGDGLSGEE